MMCGRGIISGALRELVMEISIKAYVSRARDLVLVMASLLICFTSL